MTEHPTDNEGRQLPWDWAAIHPEAAALYRAAAEHRRRITADLWRLYPPGGVAEAHLPHNHADLTAAWQELVEAADRLEHAAEAVTQAHWLAAGADYRRQVIEAADRSRQTAQSDYLADRRQNR